MVARPQPRKRKPLTSGTFSIELRKAIAADLPALKTLTDTHRHELGFVHRQALLRSIEREEVIVAQKGDRLVGFIEYHHRMDQQTTIYHIVVESQSRNQGIGRSLVDAVKEESRELKKEFILVKCPVDLEANEFYSQIGCQLVRQEQGKQRDLSIWKICLESPR